MNNTELKIRKALAVEIGITIEEAMTKTMDELMEDYELINKVEEGEVEVIMFVEQPKVTISHINEGAKLTQVTTNGHVSYAANAVVYCKSCKKLSFFNKANKILKCTKCGTEEAPLNDMNDHLGVYDASIKESETSTKYTVSITYSMIEILGYKEENNIGKGSNGYCIPTIQFKDNTDGITLRKCKNGKLAVTAFHFERSKKDGETKKFWNCSGKLLPETISLLYWPVAGILQPYIRNYIERRYSVIMGDNNSIAIAIACINTPSLHITNIGDVDFYEIKNIIDNGKIVRPLSYTETWIGTGTQSFTVPKWVTRNIQKEACQNSLESALKMKSVYIELLYKNLNTDLVQQWYQVFASLGSRTGAMDLVRFINTTMKIMSVKRASRYTDAMDIFKDIIGMAHSISTTYYEDEGVFEYYDEIKDVVKNYKEINTLHDAMVRLLNRRNAIMYARGQGINSNIIAPLRFYHSTDVEKCTDLTTGFLKWHPAVNGKELETVGMEMGICVGGYTLNVFEGNTDVVVGYDGNVPKVCIEVRPTGCVTQVKAECNKIPKEYKSEIQSLIDKCSWRTNCYDAHQLGLNLDDSLPETGIYGSIKHYDSRSYPNNESAVYRPDPDKLAEHREVLGEDYVPFFKKDRFSGRRERSERPVVVPVNGTGDDLPFVFDDDPVTQPV